MGATTLELIETKRAITNSMASKIGESFEEAPNITESIEHSKKVNTSILSFFNLQTCIQLHNKILSYFS